MSPLPPVHGVESFTVVPVGEDKALVEGVAGVPVHEGRTPALLGSVDRTFASEVADTELNRA